MLRVLFVDDEPNILQATRRATRDMRAEWEMHFAASGEEALALNAEHDFDVIVTDMRMPGMDGAELLSAIREDSPSTARVILSGYAEEEAIFRSTRVAHQFLTKPCDVETLKKSIAEIHNAQETLPSSAIRDLVGRVDQLPALGDVYQRLSDAIETGRADNEQLGRIISEDIAITAELLRLVNSAFFGLNRKVESVSQAISFLGADVLRAIVAGYSVFNSADTDLIDVNALALRSQEVAALARRTHTVLHDASSTEAAEAYLAGMLHAIGALVLPMLEGIDPTDVQGALSSNDVTNERLVFGADRFAVGGYLLSLWAFPPVIVEAVSSLSNPLEVRSTTSPVAWALVVARHVVDLGLVSDRSATQTEEMDSLIKNMDGRLRQETTPTSSGVGQ